MLPHVILHIGMSVDGRIDWGAGDEGLYYELAARFRVDAMLSGSNTMLAASLPEEISAELLAATGPDEDKLRLVVVDSRGRLQNWPLIQKQPWWRDPIALCAGVTAPDYLAHLEELGIDTVITGDTRVDMREALTVLKAQHNVNSLRIDSGGILNGVLLRAGLVNEVSVLLNPELVGGTSPRSMFVAPDLTSAEGTIKLSLTHLEQVGNGHVWLRYDVRPAN